MFCLCYKGNMISKEMNSSIAMPAVTETVFDTVSFAVSVLKIDQMLHGKLTLRDVIE